MISFGVITLYGSGQNMSSQLWSQSLEKNAAQQSVNVTVDAAGRVPGCWSRWRRSRSSWLVFLLLNRISHETVICPCCSAFHSAAFLLLIVYRQVDNRIGSLFRCRHCSKSTPPSLSVSLACYMMPPLYGLFPKATGTVLP